MKQSLEVCKDQGIVKLLNGKVQPVKVLVPVKHQ